MSPGTWGKEAGGLEAQGHLQLHSEMNEFEASLGHMRSCLKNQSINPSINQSINNLHNSLVQAIATADTQPIIGPLKPQITGPCLFRGLG